VETDGTRAVKPEKNCVPQIDPVRCTGCGRCVAACPKKIITLEVSGYRKYALINPPELCNSCGRCILNCPVEAIYPDRRGEAP